MTFNTKQLVDLDEAHRETGNALRLIMARLFKRGYKKAPLIEVCCGIQEQLDTLRNIVGSLTREVFVEPDDVSDATLGEELSQDQVLVRNPRRTPTIGDLRQAIADLSDDTPLLGVIGDHTTTVICVQRAVGAKGVVASLVLWDWDSESNGYLGDITAKPIS